jgi:elongator complex protein 3
MSGNLHSACRELIDHILQGNIQTELELNRIKKSISSRHKLDCLPGNAHILAEARLDEYEKVIEILQRKPVRTISGVAVVAVMTSPVPMAYVCLAQEGQTQNTDHPRVIWDMNRQQ